ncbi:MAG TPA: aromatic-ring-hydroxylating dioxygenase subunit beta [Chloroflexota bacterium]|nr:aromatic-ring-hydroxylating dioxygenase subunit beta [Chloroflexota bacterium]
MATNVPDGHAAPTISREEVEDFLYAEAALLDAWRLDEWLTLFTEDARYVVPSPDLPHADPATSLSLIDDDIVRLRGRVARLNSRHAYREFPWSRTRRLVSNVRITGTDGEDVCVSAAFLVYRIRNGQADPFMGQYSYRLTRVDGALKIRLRRADLDLDVLAPHGTVSIIL